MSGARFDEWDDDWIVVADEGGDPFILSRSTGCVSLATHSEGDWTPRDLFLSINEMSACLAVLGSIVKRAGRSLTDEGSDLLDEHRDKAASQLFEIVESDERAHRMLAILGWVP